VNRKRVHRLCRQEGLKVRRKPRKPRAMGNSANACHLRQSTHKDHVWCWDFAFDRTESGTTLKWLSIIDEYTRECLALKVARSITSEDVLDTLAELFAMRGVPGGDPLATTVPEFVAKAIQAWLGRLQINALYVARAVPGRTATPRASTRSWSMNS
jgi:putative transposase